MKMGSLGSLYPGNGQQCSFEETPRERDVLYNDRPARLSRICPRRGRIAVCLEKRTSRLSLGMPRSMGGPPAPKSTLITSFFTRIEQSQQSFQQRGKKVQESTYSRPTIQQNDGSEGRREREQSLRTVQPVSSAAPNHGESLLDTILREPFIDEVSRSTIPQRRARDVPAEPSTNDDVTETSMSSTSTIMAAAGSKKPRRALTSSFAITDSLTSKNTSKPKTQPSRNLAHALANRSLTGKFHSSQSHVTASRWQRKMNWCPASTLEIPLKTPTSTKVVNALAFDHEGSLLAVAHGRAEISIYDWQSVRLTTRRNTTETKAAECLPILQFKVGPFSVPIALVAWNPFNEDEIVIGLRYVWHV